MGHDPKPLAGRSILVVEDEPLIALGVHQAFRAAGADTFSASGTNAALRLVSPGLSAAVVDIRLGEEDCSQVCRQLSETGIPFVFYTGQARPEVMRRWPEAPLLTKLASQERIVEVVAGILR